MRIPTKGVGDNAYVNSRVVAVGPCKLHSIIGYNGGPEQYIHVHEAAAQPANATTPKHGFKVGAGQYFTFDLGVVGEDLDALTVCNSTTNPTTTVGAADCSIQAILRA